jgi:hypothetical protein
MSLHGSGCHSIRERKTVMIKGMVDLRWFAQNIRGEDRNATQILAVPFCPNAPERRICSLSDNYEKRDRKTALGRMAFG